MKNIFNKLAYARENVLTNDFLKPAGYKNAKNMVKQCEAELVKRYGSAEAVDSFAYLLKKIHTVFSLIDNELDAVAGSTRDMIEQCLQEYLFDRLDELQQLCMEVDEEFEELQV